MDDGKWTSILSAGSFSALTTLFELPLTPPETHEIGGRAAADGSDSTLATTGAPAALARSAPPSRYNDHERVVYPAQSAKSHDCYISTPFVLANEPYSTHQPPRRPHQSPLLELVYSSKSRPPGAALQGFSDAGTRQTSTYSILDLRDASSSALRPLASPSPRHPPLRILCRWLGPRQRQEGSTGW
ncbi:hypothetical protein NBRC10512_003026 [Rhodotorula toruloides]|uniref:RHTO0S14e03620g1_1 n=2 Tax=Rhodotorula toruloides TaxID=5286 RepID=A0A061BK94_RHOTO|nr:uncharacterized protein RHTO_05045 [Rhodotorula toruloides NP11]EMS24865.1 hypothetical protein RHTO_05045 [Rhodotorula toruloides NP11]CDR47431.1 RHTO0S14e03620g1_1 [Rhodotorula toruloides]